MEDYEDFTDGDQILNFLKVFRPIECSWCKYVLAFQHKETEKFYCARQTEEEVRKHASCYLKALHPKGPLPLQKSPGGINKVSKQVSAENGVPTSIREKEDNYPRKTPVHISEVARTPSENRTSIESLASSEGSNATRRAFVKNEDATVPEVVPHKLSSTDVIDGGSSKLSESSNRKTDPEASKTAPTTETKSTRTMSSSYKPNKVSDGAATSAAKPKFAERYVWSNCSYSSNIGSNSTVKVLFTWNVSSIQIASEKDEQSVENLQKLIGIYAERAKPLNALPEVGDMVIGKYGGDFYRGKITKVKGEKCRIEFVDFGDAVICKYSEILPVDDEIMKHPIYGMTVHLEGLPIDPKNFELTQNMEDILYSSVRAEFCHGKPVHPKKDLVEVKLFDKGGASLNEKLIEAMLQEPFAAPTPKITASVPSNASPTVHMWSQCKYSPNLVQEAQVYCQHQYSIHTYHIVAEADEEVLANFQDLVTQCIKNVKPFTRPPVFDQIVIGKHRDGYYRGRVEKVDGDNVTILFVDFGDEALCKITELFPVDDTIMKHPIYGLKIKLDKVKDPPPNFQIHKKFEYIKKLLSQTFTLDLVKVKTVSIPDEGSSDVLARLWENDRDDTLNAMFTTAIKDFMLNNS